MAIIRNLLPPSRDNWDLICLLWQFFPVVSRTHRLAPFKLS
jgi:3-oxo-5-alpha-steroid 4-dehydrogenase 1